jgi:hypothetical protein
VHQVIIMHYAWVIVLLRTTFGSTDDVSSKKKKTDVKNYSSESNSVWRLSVLLNALLIKYNKDFKL